MHVFNLKFSLSPSNFSIPHNLPTCMTWSLSKLHVILDLHLLSLLLVHQLAPPYKLPIVLFPTHRLTSGINFLTYFVSHVLIYLFLIHLFSTIISPQECHHHHRVRHGSLFSDPTRPTLWSWWVTRDPTWPGPMSNGSMAVSNKQMFFLKWFKLTASLALFHYNF